MKKIISLVLVALTLFVLSACGETEPEVEATVPTFSGISSIVSLTAGDAFDPLEGVTATDTIDGDITDDITIDGLDCLSLVDGLTTVGGLSCQLIYNVTNSNDLSAMKISTVNIAKGEPTAGENMVVNGDFEDDTQLAVWVKGEFEGGAFNMSIVEGELLVNITTVSWAGPASPRVHQAGMTYEVGKTYQVSFDARADSPRKMASQVGVLLSGAPWFVNYDEQWVFELTTEMQTFTYEFTVDGDPEVDTTDGVVTFEMGVFPEDDPAEGIVTDVYIDNVVVAEYSAD
ncbi:carbohydrate binding domain-containing protein [Candidatus Xianfuyuplasma coldseepsis]|uniref:CBM-cenC domain-containing protein n=1 Tax=Candidatus Xianfuyuplasma coldseepsis TaxID=2782163 RepID=A0A7L7KP44_9MOLU|nr:carbohydrate binding domain-containing protein [Xianfuyuplasma coldseepsis]QMS84437.1 hypothetical protein G4Z02_01320 [Xianfuyuplasma coldseepsis]